MVMMSCNGKPVTARETKSFDTDESATAFNDYNTF